MTRAVFRGKYTKLDRNNPRGLGMCDYSGLTVRHADLCKQYEYRGRGLVWTGLWVYKKFLDKPNPQNLTPIITVDPIPLLHPRPDPFLADTTTPTLNLDVSGNQNVPLTFTQFNNVILNFIGELTGDILVLAPATYNQFYANNLTTGDFTLGMNIYNYNPLAANPTGGFQRPNAPLMIPPANPETQTGPFVVNDTFTLQILSQ